MTKPWGQKLACNLTGKHRFSGKLDPIRIKSRGIRTQGRCLSATSNIPGARQPLPPLTLLLSSPLLPFLHFFSFFWSIPLQSHFRVPVILVFYPFFCSFHCILFSTPSVSAYFILSFLYASFVSFLSVVRHPLLSTSHLYPLFPLSFSSLLSVSHASLCIDLEFNPS